MRLLRLDGSGGSFLLLFAAQKKKESTNQEDRRNFPKKKKRKNGNKTRKETVFSDKMERIDKKRATTKVMKHEKTGNYSKERKNKWTGILCDMRYLNVKGQKRSRNQVPSPNSNI